MIAPYGSRTQAILRLLNGHEENNDAANERYKFNAVRAREGEATLGNGSVEVLKRPGDSSGSHGRSERSWSGTSSPSGEVRVLRRESCSNINTRSPSTSGSGSDSAGNRPLGSQGRSRVQR